MHDGMIKVLELIYKTQNNNNTYKKGNKQAKVTKVLQKSSKLVLAVLQY
jgi:hypothetical protein